jgi:hypothetical protein
MSSALDLFKTYDVHNKDGKLDFNEFLKAYKGGSVKIKDAQAGANLDQLRSFSAEYVDENQIEAKVETDARALFNKLDTNNDGLSFTEVKKTLGEFKLTKAAEKIVDGIVNAFRNNYARETALEDFNKIASAENPRQAFFELYKSSINIAPTYENHTFGRTRAFSDVKNDGEMRRDSNQMFDKIFGKPDANGTTPLSFDKFFSAFKSINSFTKQEDGVTYHHYETKKEFTPREDRKISTWNGLRTFYKNAREHDINQDQSWDKAELASFVRAGHVWEKREDGTTGSVLFSSKRERELALAARVSALMNENALDNVADLSWPLSQSVSQELLQGKAEADVGFMKNLTKSRVFSFKEETATRIAQRLTALQQQQFPAPDLLILKNNGIVSKEMFVTLYLDGDIKDDRRGSKNAAKSYNVPAMTQNALALYDQMTSQNGGKLTVLEVISLMH